MLEYRSYGTCGVFAGAVLYSLGYILRYRMSFWYYGCYRYIIVEFYSLYSRSISRIISKDLISKIKNGLCYIRTIICFFFIQVVLPTSSWPVYICPLGELLVLGACSWCRIVAGVSTNMAGEFAIAIGAVVEGRDVTPT